MFPTFSGNSRRLRNVNLSGQKQSNPFKAHSLSPATGSATSKTVANAQAGRRQRQQERDELRAARSLQRIWRGHQARQTTKAQHRRALAELYGSTSCLSPASRVLLAFPLLMSAFDVRRADDIRLLSSFAKDMADTDYAAITSGQLPQSRLWHLVHILVITLGQQTVRPESLLAIFDLLVRAVQVRPHALSSSLKSYYRMLVNYFNNDKLTSGEIPTTYLQRAVSVSLTPRENTPIDFQEGAYSEFAETFLTQPLAALENGSVSLAEQIDSKVLSRAVIGLYCTSTEKPRPSSEELLYLLAHFIDLQNQLCESEQGSLLYLETIYTQLSYLSNILQLRFASSKTAEDERSAQDEYLKSHIRSLVDKKEITTLLKRLTASQSKSASQHHVSLLAGYAIVLMRCFPDKGDDIRLQLFLADFPSSSGPQPAVKVFWKAGSTTTVFGEVLKSPRAVLDVLLQHKNDSAMPASGKSDTVWHEEWRTILLFLELYTFVMKLTDDDDFFSAFTNPTSSLREKAKLPTSRLRSSALSLPSLKSLTLFLKNLSFTLHYNASDLLKSNSHESFQPAHTSSKTKRPGPVGNYYVVPGLDFRTFKTIVTTAIQMLYERDARRKFLPTDHWHMTSFFDMTQFVPAVVSEEQRQQDLRHAGNADQNEDVDMYEDSSEDELEEHSSSVSSRMFARSSRYALMDRLRQQKQTSYRERLLATIGPKLEILRNMPYVLPFEARVRIFREFVHLDKLRRRDGFSDPDAWRANIINIHGGWGESNPARSALARHSAQIRRDSVFESAMDQFWELGEGLKEPIQITFIDDFGNEEAGIDGGGVTKEFLTCALLQVLSPDEEMFEANSENAIYPSPTKFDQTRVALRKQAVAEGSAEWDEHLASLLKRYEFIGRMIGKCLYEGILIDFVFAGFFLLKWALSASDAVYRANLNDLREMDEELYQGMLLLKNYSGDVADFGADFTVEDRVSRRGDRVLTETRNLIPNGDKIPVTNENRLLYISYVARHRLMVQPHLVTKAFLRGLGTIVDPVWLRMFNQNELQRLVGGDSSEIDVNDLRRNTIYGGLYVLGDDCEEHPTIKLFWDVVRSLPDDDRRLLLKYVTSTPRAPLLGFAQLNPKFSIRDAGSDEARLPSTSTCVNLLKLPRYSTKETLRDKLLYAIRSNARFDLS